MKKTLKTKTAPKPIHKSAHKSLGQMQAKIDGFLQMLSELYSFDSTAPGFVTAWIPEKGTFYASLVRYNESLGQGKQILCKTYHEKSALAAQLELIDKWREGNPKTAAYTKALGGVYGQH